MNELMQARQNLKGQRVRGFYLGDPHIEVSGVVRESRMRRQEMIHYVDLDQPVQGYGGIGLRDGVILSAGNIVEIFED